LPVRLSLHPTRAEMKDILGRREKNIVSLPKVGGLLPSTEKGKMKGGGANGDFGAPSRRRVVGSVPRRKGNDGRP